MERQSNFELLRIVSIMMVIVSHFFLSIPVTVSTNPTFLDVLKFSLRIGEIGVACFVLITGYFLINAKFSFSKLIKFALQVWLCGAGCLLVTYITGITVIEEKYIWKSLLPFRSLNWFANAYLLLYLAFPVINWFMKALTKKKLTIFMIVAGIVLTVLPAAIFYKHGNQRVMVMYIYMIGAYWRLYGQDLCKNISAKLGMIALGALMVIMTVFLIMKTGVKALPNSFLGLDSCLVVMIALGIFLLFRDMELQYSSRINLIAKTVFTTYLIHNNPMIDKWIWENVFHVSKFADTYWVCAYGVLVALVILLLGFAIDIIRINFIEKNVMLWVKEPLDKLQNRLLGKTIYGLKD